MIHLDAVALAAGMWTVMMAAMMMPATVPWLLTLGRLAPAGGARRPLGTFHDRGFPGRVLAGDPLAVGVAWFAGGYLAVWAGFSVAAGALQVTLTTSGLLSSELALAPPLDGLVLVAAGLYQLSDFKDTCLQKCRSPMSFFLTRWRDGPVGAFRMGIEHGIHCLGCCWALMLVAFAVGAMSLAWMAVLTLVVSVEKLAPEGRRIARWGGWLLVAWGLVRLVAG